MNSKTVFECFVCGGMLTGPRSLKRHLLDQHRYDVLVAPKEFYGRNGVELAQCQFLQPGVVAGDTVWQKKFEMYYKRANDDEVSAISE